MINLENINTDLTEEETRTIRYMIATNDMSPKNMANKLGVSDVTIWSRIKKFKKLGMKQIYYWDFGKLGYKAKMIIITEGSLDNIIETGIPMHIETYGNTNIIEAFIFEKEDENKLKEAIKALNIKLEITVLI